MLLAATEYSKRWVVQYLTAAARAASWAAAFPGVSNGCPP